MNIFETALNSFPINQKTKENTLFAELRDYSGKNNLFLSGDPVYQTHGLSLELPLPAKLASFSLFLGDEEDTLKLLTALVNSPYAQYLQQLTVGWEQGETIDFEQILEILEQATLPCLQSLNIGEINATVNSCWNNCEIGDVTQLLKKHSGILSLDITGSFELTEEVNLPNLEVLDLNLNAYVTEEFYESEVSKETMDILQSSHMPNLKKFNADFDYVKINKKVTLDFSRTPPVVVNPEVLELYLKTHSIDTINQYDDQGLTPLMHAIEHNEYELVKALLSAGADPYLRTDQQVSPIESATIRGDVNLVLALLYLSEVKTHKFSAQENTLLHIAINGTSELIETLLQLGFDMYAENKEGNIPLELCSEKDLQNTLTQFTDHGFDFIEITYNHLSFLDHTIQKKNHALARCLIEAGAPLDFSLSLYEYNYSSLDFAICAGASISFLQYLIDKDTAKKSKRNPLILSLSSNNIEAYDFFLEKNPESEITDHDLIRAAKKGSTEILVYYFSKYGDNDSQALQECYRAASCAEKITTAKSLIQFSPPPKKGDKNWWPLGEISHKGYEELTAHICENIINPNEYPELLQSFFVKAASDDKLKICQYLIGFGVDINSTDSDGNTALHLADELETIEWLVNSGADLNRKNIKGELAVDPHFNDKYPCPKVLLKLALLIEDKHYSNLKGQNLAGILVTKSAKLNDIKSLIERGISPCHLDALGRTPLMYAITKFDIPLIKYLISLTPDIHTTDLEGTNLFGQFSDTEYPPDIDISIEIMQLLLNKGVNCNQQDKQGKTPLMKWLRHLGGTKKIIEPALFLLDNIPDCTVCDNDNNSLMHYVMMPHMESDNREPGRQIELIKKLVERGLDLNHRNSSGETPIFEWAKQGNFDVLKFLLTQDVNLHVTNNDGECFLIYLYDFRYDHFTNHVEPQNNLELLKAHGFSFQSVNLQSIISLAIDRKDDELASWLVHAGAS